MEVLERLNEAIESLKKTKEMYIQGEKRLALGNIDTCEDRVDSVKWLLIAQIQEELKGGE